MNITPDAWQADSEATLAELRATRATLELAGRAVARLTEERDQAEARIQAVRELCARASRDAGTLERNLLGGHRLYPKEILRALDGDA